MFEWDRNNLRKVRAHEIKREEAEQALLNDPILIDVQDVETATRFVYHGVTAYDLNVRQRRNYGAQRAQGSESNDQEDT
jgi:hypothetical protein